MVDNELPEAAALFDTLKFGGTGLGYAEPLHLVAGLRPPRSRWPGGVCPNCLARLRRFTPNLRAPGAQIAPKFRSKMIIKPQKLPKFGGNRRNLDFLSFFSKFHSRFF